MLSLATETLMAKAGTYDAIFFSPGLRKTESYSSGVFMRFMVGRAVSRPDDGPSEYPSVDNRAVVRNGRRRVHTGHAEAIRPSPALLTKPVFRRPAQAPSDSDLPTCPGGKRRAENEGNSALRKPCQNERGHSPTLQTTMCPTATSPQLRSLRNTYLLDQCHILVAAGDWSPHDHQHRVRRTPMEITREDMPKRGRPPRRILFTGRRTKSLLLLLLLLLLLILAVVRLVGEPKQLAVGVGVPGTTQEWV